MSDTNDMRRDFEAWCKVRRGINTFRDSTPLANGGTDEYESAYTNHAWWAYQAATERATALQWQDIATAPRDTTSILVFNKHLIFEAWYSSQWDRYVVSETGGTNHINPSHWMPLPPPPAIRQGGAK